MSDYDNTNRGQIWLNDRKESDKHPDFKGDINVDGVEYWVSAWKRDPNGNPRAPSLRFSIQLKEPKAEAPQKEQPPADFDDDIPF